MDIGSLILSVTFTIFLFLCFTYGSLKLSIWIIAYLKDINYEVSMKVAEIKAKKEYVDKKKEQKREKKVKISNS